MKDRIKILFICHGNICRSPMAEFVMRDLITHSSHPQSFQIASAATSTEEIGNPVHPGTRSILRRYGISTEGKTARQMTRKDYDIYNYLIGMDSQNIRNIFRIIRSDPQQKIFRLLDFTDQPGNIADPWYTGDFETTYHDVLRGCQALLARL